MGSRPPDHRRAARPCPDGLVRGPGRRTARADGGYGPGPEPSLADLERLVRSAKAAGCRVSITVHGDIRHVSTTVNISASRMVQESLTNVMIKHVGPTDVTLVLRREAGTLRLEVTNGPPGDATPASTGGAGGGFGLMGMRERAALVGGTLTAGPTSAGGWCVTAVLPEDR